MPRFQRQAGSAEGRTGWTTPIQATAPRAASGGLLIALSLLFSWSSTAAAADDTAALLRGRVLERGSGLPLAGAVVTAEDVADTTNADGVFALLVPPADAIAVHVVADGHQPLDVTERLDAGGTVDVVYRLDRESWGQEAVTVYGDEHREEVARERFSAEELKLVPGSFGDPIRALQSLPGVARPATVEGDVVVRGAEALNTGTYVDEVPIPYLFHFFIGRSVVNPALLDDVEFYPGGMPSRFGDVTQAVVNARTLDDDPKPGVHGKVSADLLDFAASSEGLVGTFLGAHDAFALHPEMRRDANGDWQADDWLTASGTKLPYDPYTLMDSGFQRLQLRWDHTGDDGGEHVTWIAGGPEQKSSLLQGFGQIGDGIEFGRLSGWTIVGRRRDRFVLDDRDVLQAGVDVDVEPVRVDDWRDFDEETGDWPVTKDTRASAGVWGEWQRTVGKTWISPGLRVAGHTWADEARVGVEPRLSLRETLGKRWTGTAFVGRFTQVAPADRYADGVGNPDVGLMTAWQASVGAEGRWPSGIEANATVYASRTDDLVVKDTKVVVSPPGGNAFSGDSTHGWSGVAYSRAVPDFHTTTGYAYGVETMLRMRPTGRMFGWVALTLGRSLRVDDDGKVSPGDYDLPVSLVVVGERDLPKDWRLSGRFRVSSGYPYTPLYGAYDQDMDGWTAIAGEPNAARFPWFRQLDLRVDKTWTAKRARWTLYLDTFNTLNTKNAFLATYDPIFAKLVPEVWIPLVPTFGLEVTY